MHKTLDLCTDLSWGLTSTLDGLQCSVETIIKGMSVTKKAKYYHTVPHTFIYVSITYWSLVHTGLQNFDSNLTTDNTLNIRQQ